MGIFFEGLEKNYFMRNGYTYLSIFFFLLIYFSACKDVTENNYREESSGPINVVSVFSEEDLYQDLIEGLEDSLILGKNFPGLYYPPEVMFGNRHFDADLIKRFKTTRLILDVQKGVPSIEFEKNKYSKPQAYVKVTGNSADEILSLLRENQKELLENYRWADREFMLDGFKSKARQDKSALDQLNVEMLIPRDFTVVEQQPNFVWFRQDKFNTIQNRDERDQGLVTDTSQDILNLILFKVPYAKKEITMQQAHFILDSITKLYTKGAKDPREVYVKTKGGNDSIKTLLSDFIQVESNPMLSDYYDFKKIESSTDQNVYETQGWWSMTLSHLGGPFTAKLIIDEQNKMLYVVDAVMFAPLNQGVSKKRDYITSMESLFTTFKIKQ